MFEVLAEILKNHYGCEDIFDANGKLSSEAVDACVELKTLLNDLTEIGIIPKDNYIEKLNEITKDYF